MGYSIKSEKDLADALDATDSKIESVKSTMAEYDTKLEAAQGSMTETLAIVKEAQANLAKLAERQVQGTSEGKQITALIGQQLTWDALHKHPTAIRRKSGVNPYEFERADNDDVLAKFQDESDALYIMAGAMKLIDAAGNINLPALHATKQYREKFVPAREAARKAAGDAFSHVAGAGGAEGTEWNPTEFSSRLIEKARLPLKVVALIPSFNMPRSPFLFPTQLADLTSYLTGENQAAASQTAISDGKGSTVVSGSVTFSSKKLATMAFTSKEIEEDSIVPILPYLEAAVIQAVANGLENAVLNGDTAGTHMDTDVSSASDVRKAFDGLRDYAVGIAASGGLQDAGGDSINTDAAWRDHIRGARKLMADPFKGNNARLALVVSGNTAIDIGSCESWRFAYAFSQQATNSNPDTTGFSPDGLGSFVVSEFQRSDLAATGVYAAASAYTTAIQFAPQAWLLGVQRSLRIEVLRELYAAYDQDAVKITWRGDLKAMLPGVHTVATIGIPA